MGFKAGFPKRSITAVCAKRNSPASIRREATEAASCPPISFTSTVSFFVRSGESDELAMTAGLSPLQLMDIPRKSKLGRASDCFSSSLKKAAR